MAGYEHKSSARLEQITSHIIPPPDEDKDRWSLEGRVCIVTGAGSLHGIGRATVLQLAKRGAKAIYATDLRTDNFEKLVKEVESKYPGVQIIARGLDASSEEGVQQVVEDAMTRFGRLDVYFANAGITGALRIKDTTAEAFMHTMKVNALSVFLAIKYACPAMQVSGKGGKTASGGSIIATASVAGIRSGGGPVDYSASKAAVINLVQTCAYQYARTNVRINAICPGLIETDMTKRTFDYARARGSAPKIGQLNPLGRYGVASEMAHVVAFLASDESSYVNGQAWAADGGLSASIPTAPGKSF